MASTTAVPPYEDGLIALAQAGDHEAQAKLLAASYARMLKLACRFARPGVDVEDLLQEARIALLAAIQSYEPGHGTALSTWAWRPMYQAVEREAKRAARASLVTAAYDDIDDEERTDDRSVPVPDEVSREMDAEEAPAAVSSLLDGLDATDALILRLRRAEGLSLRETGERVGLSHGAVAKRERAAMAKIRRAAGIRYTDERLDGITKREGEEPSTAPGGLARGSDETPDAGEETTMDNGVNTEPTTQTETPPAMPMQSEGTVIGGTPDATATTETGAVTPPTGTEASSAGETTPGEGSTDDEGEKGKRAPRFTASEKLVHLTTIDGWVAFLSERVTAAVESATKDDPAFKPPVAVEEVVAAFRENLSVILPEIGPKLSPLATACAGARQARIDRETAKRVEKMRQKAAASKASKDRDAAQREVEALRAKLAALEGALGGAKGESPKAGG